VMSRPHSCGPWSGPSVPRRRATGRSDCVCARNASPVHSAETRSPGVARRRAGNCRGARPAVHAQQITLGRLAGGRELHTPDGARFTLQLDEALSRGIGNRHRQTKDAHCRLVENQRVTVRPASVKAIPMNTKKAAAPMRNRLGRVGLFVRLGRGQRTDVPTRAHAGGVTRSSKREERVRGGARWRYRLPARPAARLP